MDKSCCGARPACFFTNEAPRAPLEVSLGPSCGKFQGVEDARGPVPYFFVSTRIFEKNRVFAFLLHFRW